MLSSPGSGDFGICDSFVFNKDHLCGFLPNLGFLYTLRVACIRKKKHGKNPTSTGHRKQKYEL